MPAATTAAAVADFFVWFCHETGSLITNLELQKHLYYSQAWYLALHGQPLFDEPLQAWQHGPVQPAQYHRFKHNSWNPIADPIKAPKLPAKVEKHLREVYEVYGKFNGWDLERMSHREDPWIEARQGLPDDAASTTAISHESMKRYFRGRLERSKRQTR
jgi:uncharacterized phage-associated protein